MYFHRSHFDKAPKKYKYWLLKKFCSMALFNPGTGVEELRNIMEISVEADSAGLLLKLVLAKYHAGM
jgi:hypothetical protein